MASPDPLVSVIVCVYNAGRYLRPSIESLLAQTYLRQEILIVNDGSTDGCMETLRDIHDPRIRVINQANAGKPAAMNVALDQVQGEFYALHDADDTSDPRRFEVQVRTMVSNPDVAAVFSGNELILDDRRMAPLHRAKDREACRRDIALFKMPGHDPTAMYRMASVRDIRYATDLPIVEGFDYILRVGEVHPMLMLADCLYGYRIHRESVTHRNPERRDALVHEVLRRACERRGLDFEKTFGGGQLKPRGSRHRAHDNNMAAHFMDSVCDLRRRGEIAKSLRTGFECMRLHPLDPHYHKAMLYAISPMWLVNHLRRSPVL